VDASTKSGLVAIVIGGTYKTFSLKEGWQGPGRDNHWTEMIAFELLVQVLLACQYTGHVIIRSDSRNCLAAWDGGNPHTESIKQCNERIQSTRRFWPFTTSVEWVSGKKNLADPFSRGRPTGGYAELQMAITIPPALNPFVLSD
jgi:hypothetical protein